MAETTPKYFTPFAEALLLRHAKRAGMKREKVGRSGKLRCVPPEILFSFSPRDSKHLE
jgi:hypothetical protein